MPLWITFSSPDINYIDVYSYFWRYVITKYTKYDTIESMLFMVKGNAGSISFNINNIDWNLSLKLSVSSSFSKKLYDH